MIDMYDSAPLDLMARVAGGCKVGYIIFSSAGILDVDPKLILEAETAAQRTYVSSFWPVHLEEGRRRGRKRKRKEKLWRVWLGSPPPAFSSRHRCFSSLSLDPIPSLPPAALNPLPAHPTSTDPI